METTPSAGEAKRRPSPSGIPGAILNLFSSVWLGIAWAALLFVYCSVGSAMPAVRQIPALEMTEFEWFHWWPFNVLMLLLCANLIVVTVRRIPFRSVNLGVWAIHAGIIILCIGSYYYFGTKVEGDTPVFRRQVRITLPNLAEPASLVALPGSQTSVVADGELWRFSIQSTNRQWPILSEEHKGETAYAVNVHVTPPNAEPFIRQLLDGYAQYTEDVIPGRGRAIKSLGRKLIHEDLTLTLEPHPQEWFHVMDSAALFVRRVGDTDWIQRPIEGLPRYNDRIGSREQVFTDPGVAVPLRAIDLSVPPAGDGVGATTPIRVTGFLRYAHMKQRWREGGDRLNPVAQVSLHAPNAQPRSHELMALDRRHRVSSDGMVELRWFDDVAMIQDLPTDANAVLHIAVPGSEVAVDLSITPDKLVGHEGPFTPLAETGFSYRLLNVQDNLVLSGGRGTVSVAMVEIKTSDGQFTRMVADQPAMTRDMRGEHADPHAPAGQDQREAAQPDDRIRMTYQPQSAPIILAMYPRGLHLVANGPQGRLLGRDVAVGDVVEILPGLHLRTDATWARAVADVKPLVVAPSSRQRNAGVSFSMIRLEVDAGHQVESKWVRYHPYALPSEQYAYAGRFAFLPERFRLSDGSVVEVLFSRERRRLPNPVALDHFALDTHVGGYTGQALTIRNYVSHLSFLVDNRWTDATSIQVNAPTDEGGYWFFQSTWDPPSNRDPSGGMNYTGLGVGNRNGVYIQLLGCCLSVAGMIFAFYVKPVLKRRRQQQSRAKVSGDRQSPTQQTEPVATQVMS